MKKLAILFVFWSLGITAQDSTRVDLSNPQSTIYTHLYFLQKENFEPAKAAQTINGLTQKNAIEKAIKIKRVLDGKGLYVDFNRIPNDPNYNDTVLLKGEPIFNSTPLYLAAYYLNMGNSYLTFFVRIIVKHNKFCFFQNFWKRF